MRIRSYFMSSVLATSVVASWMGPALAQDVSPAAGSIETVTVTAEKRAQAEQDVPISMVALTAQDLKASTITDTTGLAFVAPNFSIYDSGSNRIPRFDVRGIFSEPTNGGIEASIPVTVDGVLQGRTATYKNALYDVDRVELLSGPQGDLYGANSIAGVMNIYTAQPTSDFGAQLQLLGGNFGLISTNDFINVPLSDNVFTRLDLSYTHHDGYDDMVLLNKRAEDENNAGFRFGVKFILAENADFELRVGASEDHDFGQGFAIRNYLPGFLPSAVGGINGTPGSRSLDYDTPGTDTRSQESTSGTFNWDAGPLTLTSITAYQQFDALNFTDDDYTNLYLLNTGLAERQHQFSQELRVASNGTGPFEYVAGLYYFNQEEYQRGFATLGTDFADFGVPKSILPFTSPNAYAGTIRTNDYAAFGQLTYHVTDSLGVVFGARYEDVIKGINFSQPDDVFFALPALSVNSPNHSSHFSPQGTLQYHVDDNLMLYAKAAQGFKAGGYNLSTNTNPYIEYKPETLMDYEAGWKGEWFDHRLLLDADVFKYDYSDLQVNQVVQQGSLEVIEASNAAKAKSQGFEIQLEAVPTPGLVISANYGYTDAKYESFPGATSGGANYSGNQLQFAAKNSAAASAQYDFGVYGIWNPTYRIEYQYRSRAFATASNDPYTLLDPVNIVNMRLGLIDVNGWQGALWAKNVFNDKYATDIIKSSFFAFYAESLGAPATFGVDLTKNF